MASNDYHFITRWRIRGTIQEVVDIMSDATDLARWWPSVYLNVVETAPGDERGVGRAYELYTRGWLPYTLRWRMEVADVGDRTLTIRATGDFDGRGIWSFAERDGAVELTYDWLIRADKPLLRNLSFALKPIFAANHRWAMAQGERSLQAEVDRRHGLPVAEPPRSRLAPLLAGAGAGALAVYLLRKVP